MLLLYNTDFFFLVSFFWRRYYCIYFGVWMIFPILIPIFIILFVCVCFLLPLWYFHFSTNARGVKCESVVCKCKINWMRKKNHQSKCIERMCACVKWSNGSTLNGMRLNRYHHSMAFGSLIKAHTHIHTISSERAHDDM